LGLSISYGIVRNRHGESSWKVNRAAIPAFIWIFLSITDAHSPRSEERRMGNILVVDDERSLRITVKAFLEMDGHSVETAEDVPSALALLQGTPFDVVLTDIILPRVSGVDLLRQIRETNPRIQVIMMTGEPTLETACESLQLGATDYLQKPIGKNEILKAVRNALMVKELSDEKLRLAEENRNYMNHLEELVEKRTQALMESEAALRNRAEELTVLNRLARKVNESIAVEDAVQYGIREIATAASPNLVVFFLREGESLVPKGLFPEEAKDVWLPDECHKVGICLCGLAVSEDRPLYAADIESDFRCTMKECLKAGFHSFAALPLRSDAEVIGVLGIGSLHPKDFSQQASFLEALATEMSIGLRKSLLYEQVQRHALQLEASLNRAKKAEAERVILQEHLQRSQKLEAIGTLASGIAHDFNNILSAVIGYTELALLDSSGDFKSRDRLKLVLAAGERARDLVVQIMAFSRQSAEERKQIQISHIVKEVLKFMRASLPTTIEIRKFIDQDLGTILADPVQIHQVVMNLCTNAHHAMKENGGVLEVRLRSQVLEEEALAHPDFKPGTYVKLMVKDTGHGMDKATVEKIFDPYFTTKEKGVGTGLGLAVVHGIVQKHGGFIVVESEPGKGSIFAIYFPANQEMETLERPTPDKIPTGHERILLIDDEQVLVDIGKQTLEHLGYTVETRTNSVEALALFGSQPDRYDLVITDMTMPIMTGDKLAVELIRIRPDIPILIYTGYNELNMEDRVKSIGVKGLVRKPIGSAEIALVIRDVLDNR
jgi:signal transduction histidine kinase/DNA-binding NtrC family response regulator